MPDREPGHFGRINIVLIGEWRVFIGSVGDFIILGGLHLTPAVLVVDGESHGTFDSEFFMGELSKPDATLDPR